jgi:hypothetical protein
MTRRLSTALLLCLCLAGCGDKVDEQSEAREPTQRVDRSSLTEDECLEICRVATGKLATALQKALLDAIADKGLSGALTTCNVEAIPIARTISIEEGLMISRTSTRFRNPTNAPDDWEAPRLEQLAARLAAGEDPATLESWQVVAYPEGHHTFRYMKAIPTGDLCISCHGNYLVPEVADRVADLYPDDLATGFAVGDLRGAFTLSLPLD